MKIADGIAVTDTISKRRSGNSSFYSIHLCGPLQEDLSKQRVVPIDRLGFTGFLGKISPVDEIGQDTLASQQTCQSFHHKHGDLFEKGRLQQELPYLGFRPLEDFSGKIGEYFLVND